MSAQIRSSGCSAPLVLETYLNDAGSQILKSWESSLEEKLASQAKLILTAELSGFGLDFGREPFHLRDVFGTRSGTGRRRSCERTVARIPCTDFYSSERSDKPGAPELDAPDSPAGSTAVSSAASTLGSIAAATAAESLSGATWQLGPKTGPSLAASSPGRGRPPTSSPMRAPSSPNARLTAAPQAPSSPPSSRGRAPRRRGSSLKALPLRQPSNVGRGTARLRLEFPLGARTVEGSNLSALPELTG